MASAVGCGGKAAKLRLAKRPLSPHAGRGRHPRPAFAELFAALSDAFVAPTADAAAAVVAASPLDTTRAANDIVVKLDRKSTAAGVYPAVLLSYLVVCDTYDTQAKADLVSGFASYVTGADGQSAAATAAGSAPLSSDLQAKIATAIASIKVKG